MCEACGPRITRRRALALAGSAVAATAWGGAGSPARAATPTGYGIDIQPRSVWAGDSRPQLSDPGVEDVRFLLVHHTASANGADPIGTMRGVYSFHTSAEKGWPDVAYNFFIDQNGIVYEARAGSLDRPVQASATGGSQGFAQLVCLLGDFTSQNPTEAALLSLNSTLAYLADRYGLDTNVGAASAFTSRGSNRWPAGETVTTTTIAGHRDMSQTACPGDTFYPYLVANVQGQVHALRGPASAPTTQAPPSTTSTTTPPTTTAATTSPTIASVPSTTAVPPPTTLTVVTAPPTVASSTTGASTSVVPTEIAAEAPSSAVVTGRDSSNGAALAIAAGAAAVVGLGAAYVGIRSRRPADGPTIAATPIDDTEPDSGRRADSDPRTDIDSDEPGRPHDGGRDPLL